MLQGREGVLRRQGLWTEGAHDEDGMCRQVAGQIVEQLQGGLTGPVQILQGDQQRSMPRQVCRETGHTLKEARPLSVQTCRHRHLKPRTPLGHFRHETGYFAEGPGGKPYQFVGRQDRHRGAQRLG